MNTGKNARKKFLQQCQKSYLCPKDHWKNRVIYWGGYIPGNITGAISFLLNITGAIAPVAPVLNTPLDKYIMGEMVSWSFGGYETLAFGKDY